MNEKNTIKPGPVANTVSGILFVLSSVALLLYLFVVAHLTTHYLRIYDAFDYVFWIISIAISSYYYFLILVLHEKYSHGWVLKKEGIHYKMRIGFPSYCIPRRAINKKLFVKMAIQPFKNICIATFIEIVLLSLVWLVSPILSVLAIIYILLINTVALIGCSADLSLARKAKKKNNNTYFKWKERSCVFKYYEKQYDTTLLSRSGKNEQITR